MKNTPVRVRQSAPPEADLLEALCQEAFRAYLRAMCMKEEGHGAGSAVYPPVERG